MQQREMHTMWGVFVEYFKSGARATDYCIEKSGRVKSKAISFSSCCGFLFNGIMFFSISIFFNLHNSLSLNYFKRSFNFSIQDSTGKLNANDDGGANSGDGGDTNSDDNGGANLEDDGDGYADSEEDADTEEDADIDSNDFDDIWYLYDFDDIWYLYDLWHLKII